MSRKPVSRALPPLKEFFPDFDGFPPDANCTEQLAAALRNIAAATHRRRSVPFYPMREISEFFRVPLALVARVYKRLAGEGLLVCRRSSMTVLCARKAHPRAAIRGVVGMPIWTSGFVDLSDWRFRFIRLEQALRKQNFITDLILSEEDLVGPAFLDRLTAHELDVLLWAFPLSTHRETKMSLLDQGVRVVSITDMLCAFPGLQYQLSWTKAVAQGIKEWRVSGISCVVLCRPEDVAEDGIESFIPAAERKHFQIEHAVLTRGDARGFLQRLNARPTSGVGIMLIDDQLCIDLYRHGVEEMIQLCRNHRVMLKPSVNIPYTLAPDLFVDIVRADWKKIAVQIACDIASGKDLTARQPIPIDAEWRPRMALSQLPVSG